MTVSENFVLNLNKIKSKCASLGRPEPKLDIQLMNDHIVRIGITVHLPNQEKDRYFFVDISSSDLENLSPAYVALFESVNFAWDRFASKVD